MKKLSNLNEIGDIRQILPNESTDFTPWLSKEENIAILAEEIGIDITVSETESPIGDFNVDIFGTETGTDRKVIIENQLEESDHDHLGKLLTYAAGKNASAIVWIVRKARDEHRAAIQWLNNHTDETIGFFLCEIKAFTIGDSCPAPKFEVVEAPNDWIRDNRAGSDFSEAEKARRDRRKEYWEQFNEYAGADTEFKKVFKLRKANGDHWMDFAMGSSKYHMSVCQIRKDGKLVVKFYISDNKALYSFLVSRKKQLEQDSGLSFGWHELPGKKASEITIERNVDFDNPLTRQSDFKWITDTMLKMAPAFKKCLAEISKETA